MTNKKKRLTFSISKPPVWVSSDLIRHIKKHFTNGVERRTIDVEVSYTEKKVYRKRGYILPSEWAAKYRIVTEGRYPGHWSNKITPYLAGIMDASFESSVREIYICKSPQVGGSEAVINCLGYIVDRCPGPTMVCYPDEQTARENSLDRVRPMVLHSRRVNSYTTGVDDDMGMYRIKFVNMKLYFAWASSVKRLANKPICYIFGDEVDKYSKHAKETGPLNLLRARLTTFRYNRKLWLVSTPTIEKGPIWQALNNEAEVIFDYQVSCPHCEARQVMQFDGIRWDREKGGKHPDPSWLERKNDACWYECEHCGAHWDDYTRDVAVRNGRWIARDDGRDVSEYIRTLKPSRIGFHIPAWLSHFVSLSECAAAFIRGLSNQDDLRHFRNAIEAKPWENITISGTEEGVLSARCSLSPQQVPSAAIALTCGIDVQKTGFWFVIRAWAFDMTSWLIQYGFLPTWDDIYRLVLEQSWPMVGDNNKVYRISRVAIDTGGGELYGAGMSMTEAAYWHIRALRGRGLNVYGIKGSSHPLVTRIKVGKPLDKTPTGRALPGGLQIIQIDTAAFKDIFFYRLSQATEQATQAAYLHKEVGVDYVRQILAEEKRVNMKGVEEWVKTRKDNHLLDCEVYAAAAADPEWPGGGIALLAGLAQRQKKKVDSDKQNNITTTNNNSLRFRVVKSRFMT